jgi:hypothetical protein
MVVGVLVFGSAPAWAVAPSVEGESFSNAGSSSVTLSARVDPEESPSTYYFEYGTSEAYGSVTATESVGAGSEAVGVLADVSSLQPGTFYHFRVVASNASGETGDGVDTTFSTFPAVTPGLPDGRFYELVSPAEPGNVTVYQPFVDGQPSENEFFSSGRAVRAAAGGGALAFIAAPSPEGGNGSFGIGEGNQYLATRSVAGGWSSKEIQPLTGESNAEFEAFSSDLSGGILSSYSALAAGAPGGRFDTLYERDLNDGDYESLFSTRPPHRSPGANESGDFGSFGFGPFGRLIYAGGSSDLSHRLFEANDALTAAAEEDPPSSEQNDLYDSVGGQLYLVNVLPEGKVAPGAVFGGPAFNAFNGFNGEEGEHGVPDYSNVISSDGSRIFWTDLSDHDLYVRENDTQPQSPVNSEGHCTVPADACTVLIDGSGGGRFWTATPDGSRVFFTDCNRLTADSTAVHANAECGTTTIEQKDSSDFSELILEGNDLYEYDLENGTLTDLTVDTNVSDSLGANVQGVLGASEDGSYVYFVAGGVLAPGASNVSGYYNLYAVHVGEAPKLVSTHITPGNVVGAKMEKGDNLVSEIQTPKGHNGDWQQEVGDHTALVSPDGRHLIYMHGGGGNSYEGGGQRQIYMYDYGAVVPDCVSCSPVGEPAPYESTVLPTSEQPTYMPRDMSVDGDQVFFDTAQALVPQDTNGREDVYEWERDGSGDCELEKGCVYLLSGGTSSDGSYFLEASENGDDVFIVTAAQLGQQSQGEALHVIDVREGVQSPAPPECSGSGCQGLPGAPPIFATPSSVTFEGVGNFEAPAPTVVVKAKSKSKAKACRKGFVKRKGRCVKRPKRRAKKSNRGAK